MKSLCLFAALVLFVPLSAIAAAPAAPAAKAAAPAKAAVPVDVSNVLEPGKKLTDPRLGPLRKLNDLHHPWKPAPTKAEWEKQAKAIRERVLVSLGLWPMPPKQPFIPVVHGKIDRGDYTVEKVFFASMPGHYVSGNLYRPAKIKGKVPGILSPHGHWTDGRFYDAGEKEARLQLDEHAEATMAGARYPLQAREVQLARLGCVVFHYDMVGRADSKTIGHADGFSDAEAELRLQSAAGLQTFNSIRALDFLTSLPEVDSTRIGVTGASGGGTQTFLLCAVDPRPTVAFPAVMVSAAMQGGCPCETSDYLRIGINNVAIAALFAPKPLGMTGADDWTINLRKDGLPELKEVYALEGAPDKVDAFVFPQFGHNYNRVSRQAMYEWFNRYFKLGHSSPIVEQDFWPLKQKELTVYINRHSRPGDSKTATELRKYMTQVSDKQYAHLLPKNAEGLAAYRDVVGTAARVMLDAGLPAENEIETKGSHKDIEEGLQLHRGIVTRLDDKTQVPWVFLIKPDSFGGSVVLWVDGKGKSNLFGKDGKPIAAVRKLLDTGTAVASIDVYRTGEFNEPGKPAVPLKIDSTYAAFTYAYNRPVLANRVHDILTTLAALQKLDSAQKVKLVGTGDAGPCVLLAAALAGDVVSDVIADARGLSFKKIPKVGDPAFLPGALKYGGLGGLAALAAPTKLQLFGTDGIPADELAPLSAVYKAAKAPLTIEGKPLSAELVAERLAKP